MTEQTTVRPSGPSDRDAEPAEFAPEHPVRLDVTVARPEPTRPARYRRGTPLHWEPTPADGHGPRR